MPATWIATDEQKQAWVTAAKAGQADREAVHTSTGLAMSKAGPQTRDSIAAFLKGATEEVRELAMDALGDPSERPTVPYVCSDPTQDGHDDVIVQAGWKLDRYRTNNVWLWGHNHSEPAIGNGLGTHVDGEKLLSVAQFTPRDLNPQGYTIGKMAEAGVIKACSVGFRGMRWEFDEALGDWGIRWLEQELLEVSTCNVGSNPAALVDQARSLGIDTQPLLGLFARALDGDQLLAVAQDELRAWWAALRPAKTFSIGALKSAFDEERAALKAKWLEEQAKRVAVERAAAKAETDEPITDWRAVAATLGASRPADLQRAMRLHTFVASDTDLIAEAREKGAAAIQETVAKADQVRTAPAEAPSQVHSNDPPSAPERTGVTVQELRALIQLPVPGAEP